MEMENFSMRRNTRSCVSTCPGQFKDFIVYRNNNSEGVLMAKLNSNKFVENPRHDDNVENTSSLRPLRRKNTTLKHGILDSENEVIIEIADNPEMMATEWKNSEIGKNRRRRRRSASSDVQEKLSEIELIRLRNIQERTELLKKLKGLSREVKETAKVHKPRSHNPNRFRQKLTIQRKLYATRSRSRIKAENLNNLQDQKFIDYYESSEDIEVERRKLTIQRKLYATRSRSRIKAENPILQDQKFIDYFESSEDNEEENNTTITELFEDDSQDTVKGVLFKHVLKYLSCSCLICGKKYSEKANLYRHLRDVHHHKIVLPLVIPFCHICHTGFASKTNVRRHISEVHDGVKYCPKLRKKYSEKANLDHHLLRGVDHRQRHFCQICHTGFTSKASVRRHISGVHDGVRNVLCLICDRPFSFKDTLKKHIIDVHKVSNNWNDYVQVRTSQETAGQKI